MFHQGNAYHSLLPYSKEGYLSYLDDDVIETVKWYGISIQPFNQIEEHALTAMADIFLSLIDYFDSGYDWIMAHDDKDLPWFTQRTHTGAFKNTLALFGKYKIPANFIGGLSVPRAILSGKLLTEVISYPFILSYKNIDVSHSTIPLIIKIKDHLTIDALSTDITLIEQARSMEILNQYRIVSYA